MPEHIKQKYAHITDSRQMISIKGLTALQLHEAVQDGIQSMRNNAFDIASPKVKQEIASTTIPKVQLPTDSSIKELVHSCLYNWLGILMERSGLLVQKKAGLKFRQQTKTLEESLNIRSHFHLHMDFMDVWEIKYNIPLATFKGATVWNFMAAVLLSFEGKEVNSSTIRDFVFNKKLLGRTNGNHLKIVSLCQKHSRKFKQT